MAFDLRLQDTYLSTNMLGNLDRSNTQTACGGMDQHGFVWL
jgi:hypothetical protein